MKRRRTIRTAHVGFVWSLCFISFLQAQSSEETLALQQQKIEQIYAMEHGDMRLLIHGKLHEDYFSAGKGSPFWLSADWTIGALQTKHVYYPELLLKYDAYLDALVWAEDLTNQIFIWVNESQLGSFWIQEKQFDYLGQGVEKTGMEALGLAPGYFELLYTKNSKLYAKREKRFQKYQDDYDYSGEFYEKSVYYLLRDETFLAIKGKKDFMQFAKDHESKMEQYIKQQGIRFRGITDEQFVQLIAHYDSL